MTAGFVLSVWAVLAAAALLFNYACSKVSSPERN